MAKRGCYHHTANRSKTPAGPHGLWYIEYRYAIALKNFRKIQGYRDLWMLKSVLNPILDQNQVNSMEQVT